MSHHLPSFLLKRSASQVKELFYSGALLNLALSCMVIFEPVYLYSQGLSLSKIMIFYGAVYALYFFLLPLGGKAAKSKGFEHAIFYSSIFLILYYLFLYLGSFDQLFLLFAPVCSAIQKLLYWPSFHADFALYGHKTARGSEISSFFSLGYAVAIIGPIIGGFLFEYGGFLTLFVIVSLLILLSNIPLLRTAEKFKPEAFDYTASFPRLIDPDHRRNFFALLGFGEELIVLTLWPIFIFLMVHGFLQLGGVASLATLGMAFGVLCFGRFADHTNKSRMMHIGTAVYSLVWALRSFAQSIGAVFLIDTFSRASKDTLSLPLYSKYYDRAKAGHLVKETIFFEMSLSVGKAITAFLLAGVFALFPQTWTTAWILAAMLSLLYLRYR